jgi:hypothetical protein
MRQQPRPIQNERQFRSDMNERGEQRAKQPEGCEDYANRIDRKCACEILPNRAANPPRRLHRFSEVPQRAMARHSPRICLDVKVTGC